MRTALLGAVLVFCVAWAGVVAVLVKRSSASGGRAVAVAPAVTLPGGLWEAAAAAGAAAKGNGSAAAPAAAPAARVRGMTLEHDDTSLQGTLRHLLRATVPPGLQADDLRRCIDQLIDEERMIHPQVDAAAVYLYEEATYRLYTGRATPLAAAVAHGEWAPGGDWTQPARSESGLDNRTVYFLPRR